MSLLINIVTFVDYRGAYIWKQPANLLLLCCRDDKLAGY